MEKVRSNTTICNSKEMHEEINSSYLPRKPDPNWLLVGLEKINHTRWIDQCQLPGNAEEKMAQLQDWHKKRLGIMQRVAMYLLCRQFFIGIGTLGVGLPFIHSLPTRPEVCLRCLTAGIRAPRGTSIP